MTRAKTKIMNKPLAVVLGIATVLPLVSCITFVIVAVFGVGALGLYPESPSHLSYLFFLVQLFVIFFGWVLMAIYIVYIFKTDHVPKDKKVMWAIVLSIFNMFVLPFFWYFYVWSPLQQEPSDQVAAE